MFRSNAHLKRDLTSGDANFLHNEDSNSSSCSNDSGTRKQNSLRSSNNSSTFAELKEESVSNVGSRAQTPTFGQQSSNENPNDVGCKEPPLIAKIEVKAAIDEQELINTTEVKVESSSNGLTTTKREPIEEPQQDTNPPVAPSATNNSNNGVNMNQSTSGAAPSSVVPTAGPMISVLPPPVANEPPQHPKRRKLAKHKVKHFPTIISVLIQQILIHFCYLIKRRICIFVYKLQKAFKLCQIFKCHKLLEP